MLLIDGDIGIYRVCWVTEDEPIQRAQTTFQHWIADILIRFPELTPYQIYLSGPSSENFRHKVVDNYKANRKEVTRPNHYDELRQYVMDECDGIMSQGCEADDVITQVHYLEPDSVIVSVDKDFLQSEGLHYDPVKKVHTTVTEEEGLRFLYAQSLIGDPVDNIKGIDGIGKVKAARHLEHCHTEAEMYDKVLSLYNGDVNKLTETMRLVYLQRIPNEWWCPPTERNYERSSTGNRTGADVPPPIESNEWSDAADWVTTVQSGS